MNYQHLTDWQQILTSNVGYWLVVTEVRSESFGLVTECRYDIGLLCAVSHVLRCCQLILLPNDVLHCNARHVFHHRVWYRALSLRAMCMYSTFGHHRHGLGFLSTKFRFCRGACCWASPWRKIAHSINLLVTHHSLTYWPSLFDAPGTEAFASEYDAFNKAVNRQFFSKECGVRTVVACAEACANVARYKMSVYSNLH